MLLSSTQLASVCLLLLSVGGYFGRVHKYLELASHFKLQYLIGSLGCLMVLIYFESWLWAGWMAGSVLLNAAALLPWYVPERHVRVAASNRKLKVLLSNVNSASTHYQALIDLVHEERPDVLIAQEVTEQWVSRLRVLNDLLPHRIEVPRDRGAGIALYSRIPLHEAEIVDPGAVGRPGILVKLPIGETMVSLLTIHPHAPLRKNHAECRNGLLHAASSLARTMLEPRIVIGDFNCSMWSVYFSDFLQKTQLVDARKGFGVLPTWPTQMPLKPLLMIPIDHCLISPDIEVLSIRTGRSIGSDHLPLIVDLAIHQSVVRARGARFKRPARARWVPVNHINLAFKGRGPS